MQKFISAKRLLAAAVLLVSGLWASTPARADLLDDGTSWDSVLCDSVKFTFSLGGDTRYGFSPHNTYRFKVGEALHSLNGDIKIRCMSDSSVAYYLNPSIYDSVNERYTGSSLRLYGVLERTPRDTIRENGKISQIIYDTLKMVNGAIRIEAPEGCKIRKVRFSRSTLGFPQIVLPQNPGKRKITSDGFYCEWYGNSDTVRIESTQYFLFDGIGTMYVWYQHGVKVEVGESGYATLYDDVPLVVPETGGSTPLVASVIPSVTTKNDTTSEITLSNIYVGGSTIAANTGVVITAAPGTYYFLQGYESQAVSPETNLLSGVADTAMTTGDGLHYKLSYSNNDQGDYSTIGFYWGAANGGSFLLPANRAYLVLPPGTSTRAALFKVPENTGINNVNTAIGEQGNQRIYDLQGRRSNRLQKGVNIVNGRKIIR